MKTIIFKDKKYNLEYFNYSSGRQGILAVDKNNDLNKFAITLNVPDVNVNLNEIIIKNHDFNNGILDLLIEVGVVDKQVKPIKLGFNKVYLSKLII